MWEEEFFFPGVFFFRGRAFLFVSPFSSTVPLPST